MVVVVYTMGVWGVSRGEWGGWDRARGVLRIMGKVERFCKMADVLGLGVLKS